METEVFFVIGCSHGICTGVVDVQLDKKMADSEVKLFDILFPAIQFEVKSFKLRIE